MIHERTNAFMLEKRLVTAPTAGPQWGRRGLPVGLFSTALVLLSFPPLLVACLLCLFQLEPCPLYSLQSLFSIHTLIIVPVSLSPSSSK